MNQTGEATGEARRAGSNWYYGRRLSEETVGRLREEVVVVARCVCCGVGAGVEVKEEVVVKHSYWVMSSKRCLVIMKTCLPGSF